MVTDDAGHEDSVPPEIRPVYAIDIVQNWATTRGRAPVLGGPNLSGVWDASDIGTYYMRQMGDALWWLGLSRDQGPLVRERVPGHAQ